MLPVTSAVNIASLNPPSQSLVPSPTATPPNSPSTSPALKALQEAVKEKTHHRSKKSHTIRRSDTTVSEKTTAAVTNVLVPPTEKCQQLTIERIYSSPSLDGTTPKALKFSPDGSRVTFLKAKLEKADVFDLWEFNVNDGKTRLLVDSKTLGNTDDPLSQADQDRRERLRLFDKGIVDYFWSSNGTALLFPLGNKLFYHDLTKAASEATFCLSDNPETQTDLQFSPKGNFISFVRNKNIFIIDIKTRKEKQLTFDGSGNITNGMAEFIAQEELRRFDGYWWSDNEEYIAFFQVDETPVKEVARFNVGQGGLEVFKQKYPETGTPNANLKLGFIHSSTGKISLLDPPQKDAYFARCNWLPDSRAVAVQLLSRDQTKLKIWYATPTGFSVIEILETDKTWINLNDSFYFLKKHTGFIRLSEQSNHNHLYWHQSKDKVFAITSGDWSVDEIKGVDEETGMVYFEGYYDSPLEKHLYSIPLSTDKSALPKRITGRHGWHSTTVSINNHCYVDTYSDPETPPQVSLHSLDGKRICWLEKNEVQVGHPYNDYIKNHSEVEFGTINAKDGQKLYFSLLKPSSFDPNKKYPVIVHVYGGPGTRLVTKSWGAGSGMWGQLMASQGYIMFTIDNRGSADRGKNFESAIHNHLGNVEVEDQKSGVDYLRTLPYVDSSRIGVFGWSYGGYMTLMMMMKAPDYFHAGISVAPVTDWTLYDTHYTEKYLNTPQNNKEGYEKSSVFPYIDGLKGPLMVVHGMSDDNVLFQNSIKLYEALQEKNKSFEMMNYPASKHAIAGSKLRRHLYEQCIIPFFKRNLAKKET